MATALLNLGATLAAVFGLGWGLSTLAAKHPDGEFRFLLRALATWWLSWFTWVVLWLVVALNLSTPLVITLLSDINTVFALLTYISLTRGQEFDLTQATIVGIQALTVVLFIDFGFWGFGQLLGSPDSVADLQARWSLALAVVGPLLFGWACSLRFGVSWAFLVSVMYAALQPFAYFALLSSVGKQQPSLVGGTLGMLAVLKVAYASAGLACFGLMPRSADNLVRPAAPQPDAPRTWGPLPVLALALFGGAALWIVGEVFNVDETGTISKYLAGFVGLLGLLLTGVDALGTYAKRRIIGDDYVRIRIKEREQPMVDRNKTSH